MRTKKISALFLFAFLLISCGSKKSRTDQSTPGTGNDLPETFVLTTDTQDAVFLIGTDWVGGGASMPILDNGTDRPKELNGRDIYFDETYKQQVWDKLPSCVSGTPEIKVMAKIFLQEKTATTSTEDTNMVYYYEAKVVELKDIFVKAVACF